MRAGCRRRMERRGSLTLDRYKMSSGFSEALMLCVTVTGLWVSEGRAEAISNYSSCLPGVPQRISRLLLVGLWSNERLKCEFKKLKKLVTSEPNETKEVTNFFVDRKIKELKLK